MFCIKQSNLVSKLLLLALALPLSFAANAQETTAKTESVWNNALAISMLAIILVLLVVIVLLANVVLGTADWFVNKEKDNSPLTLKTIIVIAFLSAPFSSFAQDATTTAAKTVSSIGGLTVTTFLLLVGVIAVELIVILVLAFFVRGFLAKEKIVIPVVSEITKPSTVIKWWDKLNSFRPITEDSKIDLGHNYDGIRELDNKLPPWWLYGFFVTILFAGVYLWRYHVAETAPLSHEELQIALRQGEEQTNAYLAKAANNVDENTVVLLTEQLALESGQKIFQQICSACHGKEGQGGVGPNLTDDYWVSGGSVKQIFKVIKYGVVEKGMKSWKDDYSAIQIAQLTSYIKTIKGTKPAGAKEPQGDLYKEEAAPAKDSATAPVNKTISGLIKN